MNLYLYKCESECQYMWADPDKVEKKSAECPRCKKKQEFSSLGMLEQSCCQHLNLPSLYHVG